MKNIVLNSKINSENSASLLVSRKSLSKSLLVLLFLIMLIPLSSSAQVCSLTLTAKNNIESVNADGRVYFIVLQNNTADGIDVTFSTVNYNIGANPDASDGSNNVILNAAILDKNGVAMTGSVHLAANETFEFQVKVTVPAGTQIDRWNNTMLTAASDKCANYSTTLNLFTFIPTPE
jgi:hypothetical protein